MKEKNQRRIDRDLNAVCPLLFKSRIASENAAIIILWTKIDWDVKEAGSSRRQTTDRGKEQRGVFGGRKAQWA
jgi:hypothetical protein